MLKEGVVIVFSIKDLLFNFVMGIDFLMFIWGLILIWVLIEEMMKKSFSNINKFLIGFCMLFGFLVDNYGIKKD